SPLFLGPAHSECTTLSLHDALPICPRNMLKYQPASTPVWFRTFRAAPESLEIYNAGDYFEVEVNVPAEPFAYGAREVAVNNATVDRKSTRLNSSHVKISYAVFCLKK